MEKPEYLVRPHDNHIFELDESNDCYRSYTCRNITDSEGNRSPAQKHFTLSNLVDNHDFFPIKENEIEKHEEKHNLYSKWLLWSTRPDGHGGSKGGTMEEYLERFNGDTS